MNHDIIEALKQIDSDLEMNINEKMSRHTTFKTGGPASLFRVEFYSKRSATPQPAASHPQYAVQTAPASPPVVPASRGFPPELIRTEWS